MADEAGAVAGGCWIFLHTRTGCDLTLTIFLPIAKSLSHFVVKDSFTFSESIRAKTPTSEDNIMASFDIKSLFMNVPLLLRSSNSAKKNFPLDILFGILVCSVLPVGCAPRVRSVGCVPRV